VKALRRAAELKITDPLLLSWWRGGLAHTLLDRGQYDDAEREARIVLGLREKALPADHPEVAQAVQVLAYIHMMLLKNEEAESLYTRSLSLFERGCGLDHPAVGRLLSEAGSLSINVSQFNVAESRLERACRILETAFGPDHSELIDILSNRGFALTELGRLDDAEPVLRRAVALAEKIDGLDKPRTALALGRLARVFQKKGKVETQPRKPSDQ
jgi:tetratricopeptide (TPR) repeat protein